MTKSEIKDLEKRVSELSDRTIAFDSDLGYHAIQCLTEEEQGTLCDVIIAAEKEHVNPKDEEVWLSKRPQEQQAVVRKILARLMELQQEEKRIEIGN